MKKLLITTLCVLGTVFTGATLRAEEPLQPPRPIRPDPGSRPPGGFELPAQSPQVTSPAQVGPGMTQVMIQLDLAPLSAVFQEALQSGSTLPQALQAVRGHRAAAERAQQALIAILVAPPYHARILGSTILASHTLIVEVDGSLIPQIRALPGVLTVRPDRVVPLNDQGAPAPPAGPSLGPVLN